MKKQFLQGMIKRHPDGFGFFIPDQSEHPDVYIPRHSMKGVMTNDRVMIEAFPERGSQRFRGEILKMLERGTKTLVGTYHKLNSNSGLVRDEGKGWGEDLKVAAKDSKNAQSGELVSVQILTYPGDDEGFTGKVTDVIGNALDPLTDIKRVLLQNHIPHQFHPDVLKEAKTFSEEVSQADMRGRTDLRGLNFITIDGATAKDFDDAILVESNGKGFKLYVAIADVSHYVKLGTAIDREAYERGTSVYFPNFVVPMLPEVLSNGLCSLNPHLPRLSLVAEMQMDFTGEVMDSAFYEAVIESKSRVTYGEAQEIIDGNDVEKHRHVRNEILLAADLAKILMAKRFKDGSLDLEIPETQIVLNSAGIPIDFIRSERLFAHRLIEEMMLAANVAVAKFFDARELAAIYRIHEPPNEEAISLLEQYLRNFGGRVNLTSQGKLQKRLTRALQEFEGKPEAQVLNILTLRSMSQAKYSADNVGHFGLGFDHYTHFTSPIRRYPDLIVHRLLKHLILQNAGYSAIPEEDLQTSAAMLSACEQRSVKAERQFQAIKKARFMHQYLGQEFEGIISSVTKFGVFVLLRQFEVDGLIRVENLSKEKLEFDEDNLMLVGKRSGVQFAIGDVVTIQVAAADPEAGQVDFQIAGGEFKSREEIKSSRERSSGRDRNRQPGRGRRRENDREQRGPRRGREQESDRGRRKNPDESPESTIETRPGRRDRQERKSSEKTFRRDQPVNFQKSKKAQVLDHNEDKVMEFLNEASTESQDRGEKFDPEKHLQKVLKKWKERMGESAAPARSQTQQKKSKTSRGQELFKKFRGGSDSSSESEGQSKKAREDRGRKSSNRGKRK